jgi:hypothetical protein
MAAERHRGPCCVLRSHRGARRSQAGEMLSSPLPSSMQKRASRTASSKTAAVDSLGMQRVERIWVTVVVLLWGCGVRTVPLVKGCEPTPTTLPAYEHKYRPHSCLSLSPPFPRPPTAHTQTRCTKTFEPTSRKHDLRVPFSQYIPRPHYLSPFFSLPQPPTSFALATATAPGLRADLSETYPRAPLYEHKTRPRSFLSLPSPLFS